MATFLLIFILLNLLLFVFLLLKSLFVYQDKLIINPQDFKHESLTRGLLKLEKK